MSRNDSGVDSAATHYLQEELEANLGGNSLLFRFLSRGTVDGVWYWNIEDPDDEWMSPEFWELFGIDPATKRHSPAEWQDIIHPDDRDRSLENFRLHCQDPNHPYDQIVRYRHADGSTVWVRCRGVALRDESGTPIRMLGAHTDLTALKQAEQDLRAKNIELTRLHDELDREVRRARNANQELREFAYAASHDLKAPVNTLSLLLDSLAEELDTDTEAARRLIDAGKQTAGRARLLVEDILHYTRVIGAPLELETVDLTNVTRAVVDDIRGDSGTTNIEIGDLPTVRANGMQMRILVHNLVSNALKFRSGEGAHHVRIQPAADDDGRLIGFAVADTGIGIAENKQDQIFELFQRLNLVSDYPGTGLGLSLCRRVVLNHNGSISVESTPGEGSRFTVLLPQSSSAGIRLDDNR